MDNTKDRDILLEIKKQVKKNSNILKDLRSKNRREALGKVIKYAVLVFIALYVWQYIQPIYNSILDTSEKISNISGEAGNFFDKFNQISDTIDKLPIIGKD